MAIAVSGHDTKMFDKFPTCKWSLEKIPTVENCPFKTFSFERGFSLVRIICCLLKIFEKALSATNVFGASKSARKITQDKIVPSRKISASRGLCYCFRPQIKLTTQWPTRTDRVRSGAKRSFWLMDLTTGPDPGVYTRPVLNRSRKSNSLCSLLCRKACKLKAELPSSTETCEIWGKNLRVCPEWQFGTEQRVNYSSLLFWFDFTKSSVSHP